jgi:membrane-associated protease RseP (regulator of RpoE activity)
MVRSALWFVATFACVVVFSMEGVLGGAPFSRAVAFAASLLGILAAHEAAHYVVARRHGFDIDPPVFLPFPFAFGTLGAVIRLRSAPPSRAALLEMGIAGPIAGAVVAFAILAVSLPWTGPDVAVAAGTEVLVFNDPLAVRVIGGWVAGGPPGRFAVLHPAALGAWVGCMLTGINLLPIGQLDGGHVLSALVPRVAKWVSLVGVGLLAVGSVFWTGWGVWAVMLVLGGAWQPLEAPESGPLGVRPACLAVIAALLLMLTFMPVPMVVEAIPMP